MSKANTFKMVTENKELIEWLNNDFAVININGVSFGCAQVKQDSETSAQALFTDDRALFDTVARCKETTKGE